MMHTSAVVCSQGIVHDVTMLLHFDCPVMYNSIQTDDWEQWAEQSG